MLEKLWTSPGRVKERFLDLKEACPSFGFAAGRKPANRGALLCIEEESFFRSLTRTERIAVGVIKMLCQLVARCYVERAGVFSTCSLSS